MAYLQSVIIRGIRSIGDGDENEQLVDFLRPLTVICGPNGTGKTTIIESLNYVITGQLPPGKMGAFIHDGQISGKSRVDASVKLKFTDMNGYECTVTRRICSLAKGKKRVNQSEESTFAFRDKSGEWRSLSSKVADINKEIITRIGLPSAILEYVVFCHQEDSNWPLGEPKELKLKFDAIFQATRYVKAIDKLKSLIKTYTNDSKVIDGKLPLLNNMREQKLKFEHELKRDSERLEKLNDKVLEVCHQLDTLQDEHDEIKTQLRDAEKATRKVEKMQTERDIIAQQLKAMNSLTEYTGSVEDLKAEIAAFGESAEFRDLEMERSDLNKKIRQLERDAKFKKDEISDLNRTMTKYQALLMRREDINDEKERHIQELKKHYDLDEDLPMIPQFEAILKRLLEEANQLKEKTDSRRKECSSLVETAMQEVSRLTESKSCKLDQRKTLNGEIDRCDKQLTGLASAGSRMTELQQQIDAVESEMESFEQNGDGQKDSVEQLKQRRNQIRQKERNDCQNQETSLTALDMKEKEQKKLTAEKSVLVEKHKSEFEQLLLIGAVTAQQASIRDRLTILHQSNENDLKRINDDCKQTERFLNAAESRIAVLDEQLKKEEKDANRKKTEIKQTLGADSSPTQIAKRLTETEEKLDVVRRKLGLSDGRRELYQEMLDEAQQNKACPTCDRRCRSNSDAKELIDKLTEKLVNLPTMITDQKAQVAKLEVESKRLTQVFPLARSLQEWTESTEPQLSRELEELRNQMEVLKGELTKQIQQRDCVEKRQSAVTKVLSDASLIDNIWRSLKDLTVDISRLRSELGTSHGNQRSLQELQDELTTLQAEYHTVEKRIDGVQSAIDKRNRLTEKLHSLREQRMSLGERAMQAETLKSQLAEKRQQLKKLDHALSELEENLPESNRRYKELLKQKESLEQKLRDDQNNASDGQRRLQTALRQWAELDKRLAESADTEGKLVECQITLDKLEQEQKTITSQFNALTEQSNQIDLKEDRKRQREEQLRRLEMRTKLEELNAGITAEQWTGTSPDTLRRKSDEIAYKFDKLKNKRYEAKGQLEQLKEAVEENKARLAEDKYANAEKQYLNTKIDQVVTKYSIEDLRKYSTVLDEAVIKFHAQRMAAVNQVLADLWRTVYKGNDIESIAIRSESVDEGEKKKAYNYRVVMTVDGIEMDMRGRCSAGQKMLASILIRLALADVFCSNCSIIALDEPTTNLDVAKVENLADMLADLIDARSRGATSRFQLFIITHDVRLVEHLMVACRPDYIYGLNKKPNGLAVVTQHRHLEDVTSSAL